jgi:hypothetical protein
LTLSWSLGGQLPGCGRWRESVRAQHLSRGDLSQAIASGDGADALAHALDEMRQRRTDASRPLKRLRTTRTAASWTRSALIRGLAVGQNREAAGKRAGCRRRRSRRSRYSVISVPSGVKRKIVAPRSSSLPQLVVP